MDTIAFAKGKAIETPHQLHLPALDGLRFFAFVLVLFHHVPQFAGNRAINILQTYGWVGVELFFVISSFLFFHLFHAEWRKSGGINIPQFYLRRVLRIYPLMAAFPLLVLAIFSASAAPDAPLRLAAIALFVDNLVCWFKGYNVSIPFSNHLWTLAFEFQVYLVIPAAFLTLKALGLRAWLTLLLGIATICFAIRILFTAVGAPHPIVWVTPFLRPESVLLGLVLASGACARAPAWIFAAAFLVGGAAFLATPVPWANLHGAALSYPLASLMTAGIVGASVRSKALGNVLSWRPLAFLGKISFGLYVFHFLGLFVVARMLRLDPASDLASWLAYVTATVAVTAGMATVSYYALERHFLRIKDRFSTVIGRAI